MSDLVVQPTIITDIRPHASADKLEIAVISGWEIVVGKGNYAVGDSVIHVQPDSMVPKALATQWGVAQYLSWRKDGTHGRVRAAKLRGVVSYGFLCPNDTGAAPGTDLAEHYGILKWEPPPPPMGMQSGQMIREHPLFHRFTDIQNLRNYKNSLDYNEELVISEKTHGTNSRVGFVKIDNQLQLVVGSHRTQRKADDCGVYGIPLEQYSEQFQALFKRFDSQDIQSLIVFGEVIGAGIQDLHYGFKDQKGYLVFDIAINGQYLPWHEIEEICCACQLPMVPVLAKGKFTFEQLIELSQGNTTLADKHIREGIVVRPLYKELTWQKGDQDPSLPRRMIFKVINPDYLVRKNKDATEYH